MPESSAKKKPQLVKEKCLLFIPERRCASSTSYVDAKLSFWCRDSMNALIVVFPVNSSPAIRSISRGVILSPKIFFISDAKISSSLPARLFSPFLRGVLHAWFHPGSLPVEHPQSLYHLDTPCEHDQLVPSPSSPAWSSAWSTAGCFSRYEP